MLPFDPNTTTFDTFAQWYLWNLGLNLRLPQTPDQPAQYSELQAFFHHLYHDMYCRPGAYAIPVESYPDPAKANKKRLNVGRIVKKELQFLYQLAGSGRLSGGAIQVDGPVYTALVEKYAKNMDIAGYFQDLSALGLDITVGSPVTITSSAAPALPPALHRLAQACSADRIHGFFHFLRCDLSALQPPVALTLADLLRVLPADLAAGVQETDAAITQQKYRRKVEPYGDFGYRIVYTCKAGVACYIHVNSFECEQLYMYTRWILDAQQSRELFQRLNQADPAFATFLFENATRCDPACIPGFGAATQEHCMARIPIESDGRLAYACKDARYNTPGPLSTDFKYIQKVTRLFREILYTQ